MLAAQRALLARVPQSLIAVSVELDFDAVRVRYIFDDSVDAERQKQHLARVPLQRLGGAEAIAEAVRYLVSPAAAFVTGTTLAVDGGEGLL